MKSAYTLPFFLAAFLLSSSAKSEIILPTVIGSNMVLQSDQPITLWGWADQDEKITVKLGGAVVASTVGAGKTTPWKVTLPAQKAGPVADIEISGSNTLTLTNVLAGDVWVCAGQSNMVMTMKKGPWCAFGGILNADQEVAGASDNQIRFYQDANGRGNISPQPGSKIGWEVCTPENAPHLSALGYFFARKLRLEVKKPIGLMVLAVGGRAAELFTPMKTVAGDADFQALQAKAKEDEAKWGALRKEDLQALADWQKQSKEAASKGEKPPSRPAMKETPEQQRALEDDTFVVNLGSLYESIIQPVTPLPIKGFIWYQGESNVTRGEKYAALMTKLIQGWREAWGHPHPFIIVALAGFQGPETITRLGQSSPLVREGQIKLAETVTNVGVVSAVDLGESANIHPANKKPVGERAALWALNHVYDQKVVCEGPSFGKITFAAGKATVPLTGNKEGVSLKSPNGFQLAGEDKKFYPAKAELKGDLLEVSSPNVATPVALRYNFQNFPESTVYNAAGLPALPMRTDNWPVVFQAP